MPLQPCRECHVRVSTEASVCPRCGCPNPTTEAVQQTESGCEAAPEEIQGTSSQAEQPGTPSPSPPVAPSLPHISQKWVLFGLGTVLSLTGVVWSPFHFGEGLVYSGIAALVLRAVYLRRWPGLSFLVFSCLALGFVAWKWSEDRAAVSEAKHELANLARSAREMHAGRPPSSPVRTGRPGDAAVLSDFVRSDMERGKEIRHVYESKVAALSIDTIVAPEAFVSKAAMSDAANHLQRLSEVEASYERDLRGVVETQESRIRELPLSESAKAEALRGYHQTAPETLAALKRLWRAERGLISCCKEMHRLMRGQYGHYSVQGNQIVFESTDALQRYNGLIVRLQSLADEEKGALAAMNAQFDNGVSRLERLAE